MKSKPIPGLDILKFANALLIVAVHCEAFLHLNYFTSAITPLLNCAVPTFFVISAYLVFRKISSSTPPETFKDNIGKLRHFTNRLCILYLFWFIAELPLVIHNRHYSTMSMKELLVHIPTDILFASTFHGAWFLSALVIGVWTTWALGKLILRKKVLLFIITFVVTYYSYYGCDIHDSLNMPWQWYYNHIGNPQNSFPVSLLWISLGYIIATDNHNYITKSSPIGNIILAFLFYMITACGIDLRFIVVYLIFILALSWRGEYKSWYMILRQSSILIYFLHFIFIAAFRVIFPNNLIFQYSLILYAMVITLCFISSALMIKMSKKKYFSWLRFSY